MEEEWRRSGIGGSLSSEPYPFGSPSVSRTHLDTHVAIRLGGRGKINLSNDARHLINFSSVVISPIVVLELELLTETGRLKVSVDHTLELLRQLGVSILEQPFPPSLLVLPIPDLDA
jgi:hypothetical protein